MRSAQISQLWNRLTEFFDRVRSVRRIPIVDRTKPIAEIVPVARSPRTGPCDAESLAALARAGLVRPPKTRMPSELRSAPPHGWGAGVLDALIEERDSKP